MINLETGLPIAMIKGGKHHDKMIYIDDQRSDGADELIVTDGKIRPLANFKAERGIYYGAGPSGSGKTTYLLNQIKDYLKVFPESDFYLFSRTDYKSDPAFKGMRVNQIRLDDDLLKNPIDIEKELSTRSVLFFDDCNTIQDKALKEYVEHLMSDCMEIGRKLHINLFVTNHLVIPNEKKFARTIMNEVQYMTVFPQSGSSQQIRYALKTYFGLNSRQINKILDLPSRWVTIKKNYPMTVIHENGVYIL